MRRFLVVVGVVLGLAFVTAIFLFSTYFQEPGDAVGDGVATTTSEPAAPEPAPPVAPEPSVAPQPSDQVVVGPVRTPRSLQPETGGIDAIILEPAIILPGPDGLAQPDMITMSAPGAEVLEIRDVPIYFATNRTLADNPDPDDPTSQFTDLDGAVTYGRAVVSLPPNHQMGELESQGWFASLLFDPDPEKHVIVQSMTPEEDAVILAAVATDLAQNDDAILMYVHGYNTSLDKAVRRTGQLTYDLAWHGPSFLFAWPSKGEPGAYLDDGTTADLTDPALVQVLADLSALEPERIVIIAHSMGNRILSEALRTIARDRPEIAKRLTTVILAAPDIDRRLFMTRLAPEMRRLEDSHFTLYASSEDSALRASEVANGRVRIGDTRAGVPVIEGFDVIDASDTVSDFFGHTYFGDNATILSDIFTLVHDDLPVDQRPTIAQMPGPPQPFWKIVVD